MTANWPIKLNGKFLFTFFKLYFWTNWEVLSLQSTTLVQVKNYILSPLYNFFLCVLRVLWIWWIRQGILYQLDIKSHIYPFFQSKKLSINKCHFMSISCWFFANYSNILHKTEIQIVILRWLTCLNHNWIKSYDI